MNTGAKMNGAKNTSIKMTNCQKASAKSKQANVSAKMSGSLKHARPEELTYSIAKKTAEHKETYKQNRSLMLRLWDNTVQKE